MRIHTLYVGELAVCCYLVSAAAPAHGAEPVPAAVVDPGDEAEQISAELRKLNLKLDTILLTHAHADHIGGIADLLAEWPGAVLACSAETSRRAADPRLNLSAYMGAPIASPPADRILKDGETFEAAGLQWRAVELPGHDPGEMIYVLGDGMSVFTGDTIFAGAIGRSDFPGGNSVALVDGIRGLLRSLDPEAALYPGNGPATRAGVELASNPFLVETSW